ncbi:hypothetical protein AGMMS50262_22000 [Bacteroidia bacterium]|nr:hypothetical protein AGMMS50262_22000 [Bacteroidia bacterium]
MKRIVNIILGIVVIVSNIEAQTISLETAKDIASKWYQYVKKENVKDIKSIKIKSIVPKVEKEELPTFYGINFEDGGYIIVSSEENIGPILAYSRTSSFDEAKLDEGDEKWWDCVNNHIKQKKSKTEKEKTNILKSPASSFNIDNYITNLSSTQSTVVNVPSLFETYQTSRWAGWNVYDSEFPGGTADNTCVPLAMAQIIKYWKFPIQGQGSYNGMDFSRQRYDYGMMPFRLTYCGNSAKGGICDDGSFDVIPGVTVAHIQEVSRLIYHCAITVNWSNGGTGGAPDTWVGKLVNYFNYSSGFIYRNDSYIANNNEAFKSDLRNELMNKRPILFNYFGPGWTAGHAVVIDGVENDNYFHFAMGRGGSEDVYYYLFDLDNDNVHNKSPYSSYYRAVYGIQPNCPQSGTVNLNNMVISSSQSQSYLSNDKINITNFVVENGGQMTVKAANEVNLGTGFEIKLGSDVLITTGLCGPPN